MERTRKMTDKSIEELRAEGLVFFQKLGGGTFRMTNPDRIIKPNQKFWADPDSIPEAFRDTIIPVSEDDKVRMPKLEKKQSVSTTEPVKVEKTEYSLKHRGGGWYNVFDGDGKQMNEQALKKEQAQSLIDTLQ